MLEINVVKEHNGKKYVYGGTFPKNNRFIADYKWAIWHNDGLTHVQNNYDGTVTLWNKW